MPPFIVDQLDPIPPNDEIPRTGSPPSPTDYPLIVPLLAIISACLIFLIWRRADSMRGAVGYRLKNRTLRGPGRIRLIGDEEEFGRDGRLRVDDEASDDDSDGAGRDSEDEGTITPRASGQTISLSSNVVSAPAAVAAAQAPAPAPPTSGREAPSAVADIFTVDDEEDADAVELPAKIDLDVTGVADEPEESKKRVAAAQLQAIENGQTRS